MPRPQFMQTYLNAWRANPVRTLRDTGLVSGLGMFSANQAWNLLSPERRRANADIVSKNMSKGVIDALVPPDMTQKLRDQVSGLPQGIRQSMEAGIQGGFREGTSDLFKSVKNNTPAWLAAGSAVLAVPTLAYLLSQWSSERESKLDADKAKADVAKLKLRRSRALSLKRRKRDIERRAQALMAERLGTVGLPGEAGPAAIGLQPKLAGWRKLAAQQKQAIRFWPRRLGGAPSTPPKPVVPAEPRAFSNSLLWGLGLGGAGLGAYNVGTGIHGGVGVAKKLISDPEAASDIVNQYASRTADLVRENLPLSDIGRVAGEAASTTAIGLLKSPWTYAGIGATVGAPYLLAYLLGGRKRRKPAKTAALLDYAPAAAALAPLGLLANRRIRHYARNHAWPALGTGMAYTTAGLGLASTVDPQLPARVYSSAAAKALPAMFSLNGAMRERLSEPLASTMQSTIGGLPYKVFQTAKDSSKRLFDTVKDSFEKRPVYSGTVVGLGATALGTLGYLLWKQTRRQAEDIAEDKPT
jgi:hypothetical protein